MERTAQDGAPIDTDGQAAGVPLEPEPIRLEGRVFRMLTATSFRQDMYVMQLLGQSGLEPLAARFQRGEIDIDAVGLDVIATAYASGQLFDLLSAVLEELNPTTLEPIAARWTVERARAAAEFFAELRDPAAKKALQGSIVAVILGFFVSGLLSSAISPSSSGTRRRPERSDFDKNDALESSSAVRSTSDRGTA